VDSNHLKGANLAQRAYKTPLTTKSHFRYFLVKYSILAFSHANTSEGVVESKLARDSAVINPFNSE